MALRAGCQPARDTTARTQRSQQVVGECAIPLRAHSLGHGGHGGELPRQLRRLVHKVARAAPPAGEFGSRGGLSKSDITHKRQPHRPAPPLLSQRKSAPQRPECRAAP